MLGVQILGFSDSEEAPRTESRGGVVNMPGSDSMMTSSPQMRPPCSTLPPRSSEAESRPLWRLGGAAVAAMGQRGMYLAALIEVRNEWPRR